MGTIDRGLQLRRVLAIDGQRYPAQSPLRLHLAMHKVFEAATTVGDRHYPPKEKVKEGKTCVFLEPVKKTISAVLFHAYVYTAGLTPDQVVRDFDALQADIQATPIKSADEEPVEVVHRVACLVLGDALVIENARVYGSIPLVLSTMRDLIRRHHDKTFPALKVVDIPSRDFLALVAQHEGIKKISARVNFEFTPEPKSFGGRLDKLFEKAGVTRYKQISATVEAADNEPIDPEDALRLVQESEGATGLSAITVTFNDKVTMSGLDEYRERKVVSIQEVRPGVPAQTEIETEMVQYLKDLATPQDGFLRIIDEEGVFLTQP